MGADELGEEERSAVADFTTGVRFDEASSSSGFGWQDPEVSDVV